MTPLDQRERRVAWPGRAVLFAYVKFQLIFYVMFFPAYFGGRYIADRSGSEVSLYLPWELQIPYMAWMFGPYALFFWIFLLPIFHFQPHHFDVLTRQSTFTLIVAALAFSFFPVKLGFQPVDLSAVPLPFAHFVEIIDTRYNSVPSLHVTFTVLLLAACVQFASGSLRMVYLASGVLIVLSTVFTHQHHLIDVVSGTLLALTARHLFPIRP